MTTRVVFMALAMSVLLASQGMLSRSSAVTVWANTVTRTPIRLGISEPRYTFLPMIALRSCGNPMPARSVQAGIAFLKNQFNPTLGLLRESPTSAPDTYWLTNDNALARLALAEQSESNPAATLATSLQQYGRETNEFIEIVWGVPIDWPPAIEFREMITTTSAGEIVNESHALYSQDGQPRDRFLDWLDYSNLALLRALNEYNLGNIENSRTIYRDAVALFDGVGFPDKVYQSQHFYETYKLALALYVGAQIGTRPAQSTQLLTALRQMQMPSGGFATRYQSLAVSNEDANTESTALALLALTRYPCEPP